MRDYLVLGVILAGLPICVFRPYIGTLYWAWISFMSPHRYAWGMAVDFPVAMVVALAILLGFIFSREKKWPPLSAPIFLLIALWAYFGITTTQAFYPDAAKGQFEEVSKIILMALVTLTLCQTRKRFETLFLVVAISLGLVALKGGIFGFATGGAFTVYGPPGTFLADNNSLALGLNMVLPVIFYLSRNSENKRLKRVLQALLFFTIVTIVLTFSRGGFLGLLTVLMLIGLKSKHKIRSIVAVSLLIVAGFFLVPDKYLGRVSTISEYSEDRSSMGRINAWWFAFNLAKDRPFLGGGFQAFTPELFQKYAAEPEFYADAHSNYFEMLGEHGFIALMLYLLLLSATLWTLARVRSMAKKLQDFSWAVDYSNMLAIGLIAYMINGLFLGMAYFDLYYHFIIGAVLLKTIVFQEIERQIIPIVQSEMAIESPRSNITNTLLS